ncbi:hypothetical protein H6G81_35020 [Scytonema hofmannii FACHB-248]|uniref:Phage protein n=1 Tax=Scytonema hofmannii FACHB-248 TaxID=1842502 RepID=A0ABR8H268_9CYAN|nr:MULTISPECIES: hypothetical protein [Nostocales]MBD2609564.1 hypothetical protein [Scytonema hofmannii FACHB-248]
MKIETITYKRIKNLGNFQSETFEAMAIISEGEDPHMAGEKLRSFVWAQLYPPVVKDEESELPEGF